MQTRGGGCRNFLIMHKGRFLPAFLFGRVGGEGHCHVIMQCSCTDTRTNTWLSYLLRSNPRTYGNHGSLKVTGHFSRLRRELEKYNLSHEVK